MIREFSISLHSTDDDEIVSSPENTFCRVKLFDKGLLYEIKYTSKQKNEDTELFETIEYDQFTNVVKSHISRVDFFWVTKHIEGWKTDITISNGECITIFFANQNTKEGIVFYKELVNWLYS